MSPLFSLLGALVLTAAAVDGQTYMGCYRERSYDNRLLKAAMAQAPEISNTHEVCIDFCRTRGYAFAGVQFGRECWCDNIPPPADHKTNEEECNMKCSGNRNENCGAWMRMGIYNMIQPNPEVPNYQGCYAPGALKFEEEVPSALTREQCKAACEAHSFLYFGMENGSKCRCGNVINSEKRSDEECHVQCDGNKFQYCGGNGQQVSIFRSDVAASENVIDEYPTTAPPPTEPEPEPETEEPETEEPETEPATEPATEPEPEPETEPATEPATEPEPEPETEPATEPATEAPTTAVPSKCPCGPFTDSESQSSEESEGNCQCVGKTNMAYAYGKPLGCFNDPMYNCLKVHLESHKNSVDFCIEVCRSRKRNYAALRGTQCMCGTSAPEKKSRDCSFPCPGNPSELCGGKKSMSVYEIMSVSK